MFLVLNVTSERWRLLSRVLHNHRCAEKEEFRLVLTSKFLLDQTDLEDEQNLKIVNVEYSHPWLTGRKELG